MNALTCRAWLLIVASAGCGGAERPQIRAATTRAALPADDRPAHGSRPAWTPPAPARPAPALTEADALRAVGRYYGRVKRKGSRVVGLEFDSFEADDDLLRDLAPLTEVAELSITGSKITDAGLKQLTRLPRLQMIEFRGAGLTGAGLGDLAPLEHLRTLNVI